MDKLRVILVTPKAPDPFGGTPAQWYYLVAKGLADRGHRVTCLAAYRHPDEARRAREALAGSPLTVELFAYPSTSTLKRKWRTARQPYSYFISDDFRRCLARTATEGYDILHIDDIWTGYLGLGYERSILFLHHLLRLDFRGMGAENWTEGVRMRLGIWAETQLINQYTNVRVESDQMSAEVRQINPAASIFDAPCAVDTNLYEFRAAGRHGQTVGLMAAMNWHVGRWAAERLISRIWPRLKAKVPDAKLVIVGWGARKALAPFVNGSEITILEDVPEIEPYFRQFSVLAYPLTQGSGVKVKVLEAMAYGLPVVSTTAGMEGLAPEDGIHAFIADDDETFVEKTAALLANRAQQEQMSRAARRLVEDEYSMPATVRRLERIYPRVIAGR